MTSNVQPSGLREQYDDQGYVVIQDALDADLVREAVDHVQWLQRRYPHVRPEAFNGSELNMKDDPFWVRLVSDDRLLDIAERFIGPDIALFASHYIAKPPFDGQPVLWHQDGSFWPLEPMEVITLWLAVDDVDEENGCMQVIPRTQHLDLQALRERRDVANALGASMDESLVDEQQAVSIILRAGDVSVHHPNVIHGSKPNVSSRWRRGLTIRYVPCTTRILSEQPWDMAFHLRGNVAPGVNTYQPWPLYTPERHMPFHDASDWNERARAWNGQPR